VFSIEHILRVPQPQHASEVDCICCSIERDSLLALNLADGDAQNEAMSTLSMLRERQDLTHLLDSVAAALSAAANEESSVTSSS
jgi:hypothetical protein